MPVTTADFLEKSTWTLAITLLVLTLSTIFVIPRGDQSVQKVSTKEILEELKTSDIIKIVPLSFRIKEGE